MTPSMLETNWERLIYLNKALNRTFDSLFEDTATATTVVTKLRMDSPPSMGDEVQRPITALQQNTVPLNGWPGWPEDKDSDTKFNEFFGKATPLSEPKVETITLAGGHLVPEVQEQLNCVAAKLLGQGYRTVTR